MLSKRLFSVSSLIEAVAPSQVFINQVVHRQDIGLSPSSYRGGKWDADAVPRHLIKRVQQVYKVWVYIYDETKAIKTGKSQWGLHFFRNFSFYRRRINLSKYQFGHRFGSLGLLCETATGWTLFPVWVKLICPQKIRRSS